MTKHHALALFVTAVVTGCGTTTQFAATNSSPRPLTPVAVQQVKVISVGATTEGYIEVGLVEAHQTSGFSRADLPDFVAALRETAAERGCDAVLVNGPSDHQRGAVGTSGGGVVAVSSVTLEGLWGTCLVHVNPHVATGR